MFETICMAIKLIHSNLKKHNRINLNLDFKMRVICETDPRLVDASCNKIQVGSCKRVEVLESVRVTCQPTCHQGTSP